MDKTPISVLQDFASRLGLSIDYQLLSVEGYVHAPTFVYRVQIGEIVANAHGQSKKKAKHAAALTALNLLLMKPELRSTANDELVASLSEFVGNAEQKKNIEEMQTAAKVDSNPVGKLQELCMRRKWPPPHYDKSEETGLPHEREFTMLCAIEDLDLYVTGTGRSKKVAKRIAAQEMLDCLEKQGLYDSSGQDKTSNWEASTEKVAKSEDLVKDKIDDMFYEFTAQLQDCLEDICEEMRDSTTEHYSSLESVAASINCHVKCILIPASKKTEQHLCLVEIVSTTKPAMPVLTGWGSAETAEDAKKDAAKRTMILLSKVLSKEPA